MVVLRSTTPCVAVSSRRSSNLPTVNSMVVAAMRGRLLPAMGSPDSTSVLSYIKYKSKKPVVTVGSSEKWKNQSGRLAVSGFDSNPLCEESVPALAEASGLLGPFSDF